MMMNSEKSTTLYVSDMDGTLLNSQSVISPATAAILSRVISAEALFTVATARTPATVVPLLSGVGVKLPYIVMTGAAMWNNSTRGYECVRAFSPETVCCICGIFERHGLHPLVYRRHGSFLEVHHTGDYSEQEQQFVAERQNLELKHFMPDDPDYSQSPDDALLIFSMQNYERLRAVHDEIAATTQCSVMFYHDIFDPQSGILELYAPGTSKSAAIATLASRVGADRVVVFGDNRNDIDMMRRATHAVAVAGAVPETKAVASEIIGSNDADSVARWIEKDFFSRQ